MLLVMAIACYSTFLGMPTCLQSPRSFSKFLLKCSEIHVCARVLPMLGTKQLQLLLLVIAHAGRNTSVC